MWIWQCSQNDDKCFVSDKVLNVINNCCGSVTVFTYCNRSIGSGNLSSYMLLRNSWGPTISIKHAEYFLQILQHETTGSQFLCWTNPVVVYVSEQLLSIRQCLKTGFTLCVNATIFIEDVAEFVWIWKSLWNTLLPHHLYSTKCAQFLWMWQWLYILIHNSYGSHKLYILSCCTIQPTDVWKEALSLFEGRNPWWRRCIHRTASRCATRDPAAEKQVAVSRVTAPRRWRRRLHLKGWSPWRETREQYPPPRHCRPHIQLRISRHGFPISNSDPEDEGSTASEAPASHHAATQKATTFIRPPWKPWITQHLWCFFIPFAAQILCFRQHL